MLFGLTMVSVLAGAGYAQWTDSVKLMLVQVHGFYVNNTQSTYVVPAGWCNVTNTVNGTDITSTISRLTQMIK